MDIAVFEKGRDFFVVRVSGKIAVEQDGSLAVENEMAGTTPEKAVIAAGKKDMTGADAKYICIGRFQCPCNARIGSDETAVSDRKTGAAAVALLYIDFPKRQVKMIVLPSGYGLLQSRACMSKIMDQILFGADGIEAAVCRIAHSQFVRISRENPDVVVIPESHLTHMDIGMGRNGIGHRRVRTIQKVEGVPVLL